MQVPGKPAHPARTAGSGRTAWPEAAPVPDPEARTPRAWIAPLVSTALTVPAALLALLFVCLAPMACDSCRGSELSRFEGSFGPAFAVFACGLAVPAALLIAAWTMPWQQRNAARRTVFAAAAFLLVPFLYLLFLGLIDWPA